MKRWNLGFTLIELLVAIGIITLLVGILLPALAGARRQAKCTECQNNLHQLGLSMHIYAGDYSGQYPRTGRGHWLFDVAYSTTDYVLKTGGDRENFYCPLEGVKNPHEDIFWRATECWQYNARELGNRPEPASFPVLLDPPGVTVDNRDTFFRITGYLWLLGPTPGFERLRPAPWEGTPPRSWLTSSSQAGAAETEFIVDITVSTGREAATAQFHDIEAGLWDWGIKDKTAHLDRRLQPQGGHALYGDGHVVWRPMKDLQVRFTVKGEGRAPYHWW